MKRLGVAFLVFCSLLSGTTEAKTAKELIGNVQVGPTPKLDKPINVPAILWGGEQALFMANGGVTTTTDSIFSKLGLNINITHGDDSIQQAKDYISGKSPFYRGTFRMGCLFAEQFNADPRTKPVMFLQQSYSLGDHMVAIEGIKNLDDIKKSGKKYRVCFQEGGPHLGLIDDTLHAIGATWDDIEPILTKDLVGPNGPAEKLRKGECDIACVVTPDMIGLCSGLDQVGSGLESTVKGCHVVNSTSTMSRSIPDVYICRKDFFDANTEWVKKFTVGYLQASEIVVTERKQYDEGMSPVLYIKTMQQLQDFFGKEALPTVEEDVHGLILDCSFARIPGNEVFFNDENNLAGFQAKQTSGLEMAIKLGYAKNKFGFDRAKWDYTEISKLVGVAYTKPVYATGRIKAEVADFENDLDSSTIFSFEIYFEPDQITFPMEVYGADFKRFCEAQATFGNAAIVVKGHSDPTLCLQHFYWASLAKGLLQKSGSGYVFNGKALNLTDTTSITEAIQNSNLSGQQRVDSSGVTVEIPDPKTTVAAALTLSNSRAVNVKTSIEEFAKKNGYQLDLSSVLPIGVGISDPVVAKPKNLVEAKKNMRVVFRVVRVKAEALSENDFNFGE